MSSASVETKTFRRGSQIFSIFGQIEEVAAGLMIERGLGQRIEVAEFPDRGRLCHMAVDDEGHCKGLPFNKVATEAYHANCYPGTTHPIVGPAVIFGGLLP